MVNTKSLGLTSAERRSLSSLRRALLGAVAELRDAWMINRRDYDGYGNRVMEAQLIVALKTVLATESMQFERDLAMKVLRYNLDVELGNQLLNQLYPLPWKKGESV